MKKAKYAPLRPGVELKEAEETRRVKKPTDFAQSILTEDEFMGVVIPERKWVLKNLVVEESITVVNGYRGSGKSWFMMAMANEATWGGEVGPWRIEEPINSMIIDGEMPLVLLQERLKMMNRGRDRRKKRAELFLYPEAYAYRIGLNRANLLEPRWREGIAESVVNLGIKLLIIDNLSSLAPGIDENDKMSFDPINRWLLELRFHGVAIIMTHHTGKTGEQRGTSAHEDHVDTALLLRRPAGATPDMGCKFMVTATKDRAFLTKGERYVVELVEDPTCNNRLKFEECATEGNKSMMLRHNPNMSRQEARKKGISDRTYYRIKREEKE